MWWVLGWASVVVVAQISCQDEMAIERSFSGNIAAVEPVLSTSNLSCIEVWAHWHELVVSACVDARVHNTLNRLRAHVKNQANSVVAILGPPGTGKTTTLVACVSSIVEFSRRFDVASALRCLVMAESNTAVSVLEKRMAKQVPNVVRVMTESRLKSAQAVDSASLPSEHSCRYVCNKNTTGLQSHMDSTGPLVMVASMGSLSSPATPYDDSLRSLVGAMDLIAADESAQVMPETSAHVPIFLSNRQDSPGAAVFVGYYFQLPAYNTTGLEMVCLLRALACSLKPYVLDAQFRMPSGLGRFISACFYAGQLTNGIRREGDEVCSPFVAIDCTPPAGYQDCGEEDGRSSLFEARIAVEIAIELKKRGFDVVILTCYRAQRKLIQSILKRRSKDLHVPVSTVDGFQGDEASLVIFTPGRCRGVGFAEDPRRINVACSRAKDGLIILHHDCLLNSSLWWQMKQLWVAAGAYWQPGEDLLRHKVADPVEKVCYETVKWVVRKREVDLATMDARLLERRSGKTLQTLFNEIQDKMVGLCLMVLL